MTETRRMVLQGRGKIPVLSEKSNTRKKASFCLLRRDRATARPYDQKMQDPQFLYLKQEISGKTARTQ